jgi:hypothetical protein
MNEREKRICDALDIHNGFGLEDKLWMIKLSIPDLTDDEAKRIEEGYTAAESTRVRPDSETGSGGVKEDFMQNMDEKVKIITMKEEIEKRKVTEAYDKYIEGDQRTEKLKSMNFMRAPTTDEIEKIKYENVESFHNFKNAKAFISHTFNGIVPFTIDELLLVLGETGASKTTIMANIAWSIVKQKNPLTGEFGSVLIVTNEEKENDLFNRIATLPKLEKSETDNESWYYADRGKFDTDQVSYFNKFIEVFKGKGHINVIGLDYEGESEFTCCLENVIAVLDQLSKKPGSYDCVIIDYYQNIRKSIKNPFLDDWAVQREFAAKLNYYKNKLGCPLVLMAQMNPISDSEKSWKRRIVGTKDVANPCTFIMEVIKKKDSYTTEWIFHKSRYAKASNGKLVTGFKYGRIVPKDSAFDAWAGPYLESLRNKEDDDKEFLEELRKGSNKKQRQPRSK